mmetsp:Transcript_1455/g.1822  ORF Transcript_1455/g.1822 Transcript_1455/m.1822 type:complete len:95 (+) Transcript_1455:689-973(+)
MAIVMNSTELYSFPTSCTVERFGQSNGPPRNISLRRNGKGMAMCLREGQSKNTKRSIVSSFSPNSAEIKRTQLRNAPRPIDSADGAEIFVRDMQ